MVSGNRVFLLGWLLVLKPLSYITNSNRRELGKEYYTLTKKRERDP